MGVCGDYDYDLVEFIGVADINNGILFRAEINCINAANNTADITPFDECQLLDGEDLTAVSFFYHCQDSTGTVEDLERGNLAFNIGDVVYALLIPARSGANRRAYIIGHVDIKGTNRCLRNLVATGAFDDGGALVQEYTYFNDSATAECSTLCPPLAEGGLVINSSFVQTRYSPIEVEYLDSNSSPITQNFTFSVGSGLGYRTQLVGDPNLWFTVYVAAVNETTGVASSADLTITGLSGPVNRSGIHAAYSTDRTKLYVAHTYIDTFTTPLGYPSHTVSRQVYYEIYDVSVNTSGVVEWDISTSGTHTVDHFTSHAFIDGDGYLYSLWNIERNSTDLTEDYKYYKLNLDTGTVSSASSVAIGVYIDPSTGEHKGYMFTKDVQPTSSTIGGSNNNTDPGIQQYGTGTAANPLCKTVGCWVDSSCYNSRTYSQWYDYWCEYTYIVQNIGPIYLSVSFGTSSTQLGEVSDVTDRSKRREAQTHFEMLVETTNSCFNPYYTVAEGTLTVETTSTRFQISDIPSVAGGCLYVSYEKNGYDDSTTETSNYAANELCAHTNPLSETYAGCNYVGLGGYQISNPVFTCTATGDVPTTAIEEVEYINTIFPMSVSGKTPIASFMLYDSLTSTLYVGVKASGGASDFFEVEKVVDGGTPLNLTDVIENCTGLMLDGTTDYTFEALYFSR